jgi:hypothetical protein
VTDDQIAVFVYDLKRVGCLQLGSATATGETDIEARENHARPRSG